MIENSLTLFLNEKLQSFSLNIESFNNNAGEFAKYAQEKFEQFNKSLASFSEKTILAVTFLQYQFNNYYIEKPKELANSLEKISQVQSTNQPSQDTYDTTAITLKSFGQQTLEIMYNSSPKMQTSLQALPELKELKVKYPGKTPIQIIFLISDEELALILRNNSISLAVIKSYI